MDLIYATDKRVDLGVLRDYDFDLAYGIDENDFSLKIDLGMHCCRDDYIVYMVDTQHGIEEPTEYGGIIDSVTVDTDARTVTYAGRTWHGVLSKKVIEPDPGQDYKIVTGDAHEIITGLLEEAGLADTFAVSTPTSVISVSEYQFARYTDMYTGISKMLAQFGGKLKVLYSGKKVLLTADWLVDFSQDDEWDSSQVDFKVKKNINPVNHLVCLGRGDLKDRAVIHLFTDDNGGVQPYAFVDNPVKDEDYILDKRNQLLFGMLEVYQTYDYSDAEITENYVPMDEQPDDWGTNYASYFVQDNSGKFDEVEGVEATTYTPLASQPANWDAEYSAYYTADGKTVEGVPTEIYQPLTAQPEDWANNWGNYYEHFWDGVAYTWQKIGSASWKDYQLQTAKPSDWQTNYGNYFKKVNLYKETKDKRGKVISKKKIGVGYGAVEKVKKGSKKVVPTWQKGKYYTQYTHDKAPAFNKGLQKYRMTKTTAAPPFELGLYYSKTTETVAPAWAAGIYYVLYYDRYAELVRYGIEKLAELAENGDSISINLSLLGDYDVGDIVGANDNSTGIAVWQPITKKIISIERNKQTISYKIGANE